MIMDQTNSVTAEIGERRSVSGCMLKLEESTGLPDRLEVGGERKGGVGNDTQVSGPSIWKNGVAIY